MLSKNTISKLTALITQESDKSTYNFHIKIHDISDIPKNKVKNLNVDAPPSEIGVYYDPRSVLYVRRIPNSFYCTNEEELCTIVEYIIMHKDLFQQTESEDVLDCCEIVSLETIDPNSKYCSDEYN